MEKGILNDLVFTNNIALYNLPTDLINIVLSFVKNYDIYKVEYIKSTRPTVSFESILFGSDDFGGVDEPEPISEFIQRIVKVFKTKDPLLDATKFFWQTNQEDITRLENNGVCFSSSYVWKTLIKSRPLGYTISLDGHHFLSKITNTSANFLI